MSNDLGAYIKLLELFDRKAISGPEFEREYLALFKHDTKLRPEEEFAILDRLFASVDAFCSDPEICDEGDLSEDELRLEVTRALKRLKSLPNRLG